MKSPELKICGLRRVVDAEVAVDVAGAGWVGCVLAADSPRCASIEEVRDIVTAIGDRARCVLVFRDVKRDALLRACALTSVRRVQVHGRVDGQAPEAACADTDLSVHRVLSAEDLAAEAASPQTASAREAERRGPRIVDVGRGGSGQRFDWRLLAGGAPSRTFIAGGVTPNNVNEILPYRPWGLDVSSGVEHAPGVKDHDAMRRFGVQLRTHSDTNEVCR